MSEQEKAGDASPPRASRHLDAPVGLRDEIYIDHRFCPAAPPREPADSDPKFIKHVYCEGATWHVIHYDSNGSHCSERDCIINKQPNTPIRQPSFLKREDA